MLSHPHTEAESPVQLASHVTDHSTSSAPPSECSYFPYTTQWPNSNFSKRRLCPQRQQLTGLFCALMVVFLFGGYFCRLKSRSGHKAMLAARRLAGADEANQLHSLEEGFVSNLCKFTNELVGDEPLAKATDQPSVSTESAEVQTGEPSGKRKRKARHIQQHGDKATEILQGLSEDLTEHVASSAELWAPFPEYSTDEAEAQEQLAKRARIAEWSMDPVGDIELLLEGQQNISPGELPASEQLGFDTADVPESVTVVDPQPEGLPTAEAFLPAYQLRNASEGSSSGIYFWETAAGVSAAHGAPDEEELLVGESHASFDRRSYSSNRASNILPQVISQHIRAGGIVVHASLPVPWQNYGEPSQAPFVQHQQLSHTTYGEAQLSYPLAHSFMIPTVQLAAVTGTQKQPADTLFQRKQSVADMVRRRCGDTQTPLNQEEWLSRHPFYRLPDLLPGVEVRNFDWRRPLLSSAIVRHVPQRLTDFQRLINKQALSQEDVDQLTHTVWDLLRFASSTKSRSLAKPIGELLEPLSLRFLIADALWCACELFGKLAEKERWWAFVMDSLTAPPLHLKEAERQSGKPAEYVLQVCQALSVYRSGNRPSGQVVVNLKKTLFGPPPIHRNFGRMVWDWWRREAGLLEPPQ